MPSDEWTPNKAGLAANLRHLRLLLDRRTPRFEGVGELQRVGALLCSASGMDGLREVVQLAIDHEPQQTWSTTAPLLYGLTSKSQGKLLARRRELAYKASREKSRETWRTARESEMSDDLAETLIALVIASYTGGTPAQPATSQVAEVSRHIALKDAMSEAEIADARRLVGPIVQELRTACERTCWAATESGELPRLGDLAEALFPDKELPQDVENLLAWAIHYVEPDNERRQAGMNHLFGLGNLRWLDVEIRRRGAEQHLRHENDTKYRTYRRGEEEVRVFEALANVLSKLIIEGNILVT